VTTSWVPTGFDGASATSWLMDDPVSLPMIRLWCEVLEDSNPVYYDMAEAAKYGFEGIVAPAPMIMAWMNRAEWTPQGSPTSFSDQLKSDSSEYPHGAGLRSIQVHTRPLRLGEQLWVHQFISGLSEPSASPRGYGCRQRRYVGLRDEAGTEVARIEFETLRMKTVQSEELPLREMPQFVGPQAQPVEPMEGHVLPPLEIPISYKRCIKWVAATRDFYEVHLDPAYARQTGAQDLYIGVHFFQGLVGRYITDWTGPSGVLRRMDFAQEGRCFPGENATVVGRVAAVRRDRNGADVELDISVGCERGRLYDARATVRLPGPVK